MQSCVYLCLVTIEGGHFIVIWCQTIMLVAVWLWTLPIQIKTFLLYFKTASQSWSEDIYHFVSFCQHAIALSYFFLQQRYLSVRFTNQAVAFCCWVFFWVVGGRDSWEDPVAVEKEKWKCLGHGMWHVARSLLSSPLTIMIHQGFISVRWPSVGWKHLSTDLCKPRSSDVFRNPAPSRPPPRTRKIWRNKTSCWHWPVL